LEALGRRAAARAALLRALTQGAAEGHNRSIFDAGRAIQPLLEALGQELARLPESSPGLLAYVTRLGAGQPAATPPLAMPAAPGRGPAAAPPGPLSEPLSSRELAILRLLAAGCSNQEIAGQLILALSTV